jgi:hypothetical protein
MSFLESVLSAEFHELCLVKLFFNGGWKENSSKVNRLFGDRVEGFFGKTEKKFGVIDQRRLLGLSLVL